MAAYNDHDAVAFAAAWTRQGILQVANGQRFEGREQIQAGAEEGFRAFPDWHLELQRVYENGEHVWLEWTVTGTHEGELMGIPPTHRRFAVDSCSHMVLGADGLIPEDVVYFDGAALFLQLGLLPELEQTQAG